MDMLDFGENAAGAPVDSPAFTGTPTAPTPATGDNDTSIATTAFVQSALSPGGDCYLQVTGSNLILLPERGNKLWINGKNEVIPAAGVTLVPSGLTATTAYFIYAYMVGATMTLEASATAPETNTTTGVRQKTGDATRTLVGLWMATGAAAFSAVACQGASWFNPRQKMGTIAVTNATTTSATLAELAAGSRLRFVNFSGRTPRAEVWARAGVSVATSDAGLDIGLDGITAQLASSVSARNGDTVGNEQTPMYGGKLIAASEGLHYVTPLGSISTGTGTFNGVYAAVTIEG